MLTKFRNFTDAVAEKLIGWLCDEREVFNSQLAYKQATIEFLESRVRALESRNTQLEQSNEDLLLQRIRVRQLSHDLQAALNDN